ncbi:MAG TPA: hypothetical protein VE225_05560 [Rubrobacteraceae bacterium]|nr:hypothetical protein [Rubrobacteraceae bacterium]
MEAMPAKSSAPDVVGMNDMEGRTLAGDMSPIAGSRNAVRKEMDDQKDWASLVAADPALWLKGLD